MIISVNQVPGVSKKRALAMEANGVCCTSDLLRVRRATLASAIGVSVDDVRKWQAFSELLEVEGLNVASAAALLTAGIDRLGEFSNKSLSTLKPLLSTLVSPMSDDQIVAALLAARELQFTGVVNGTVITTDGVPLQGATVVAGGQTVTSDAQGRFRIVGLRLASHSVTISHPAKKAKIFGRILPHSSEALIKTTFKLTGSAKPLARLSAMNGDVLPPLGTAPISTESRTEALNPADRFVLTGFYSNRDGKLSSLFRDFSEGSFVIRTYRVKSADLPASSNPGDRMMLEAGKLVKADITARDIGRLTRLQAVRRRYAGKTVTEAMKPAALRSFLTAISDPKR